MLDSFNTTEKPRKEILKKGSFIFCKVCNKEFYVTPSILNKRKYCSFKCYYIREKGKTHTEKTKENLKQKALKQWSNPEMREKMVKRIKETANFKKGHIPWNKGKTWSETMKKRISETNKRKGIEPKIKYVGKGEKGSNYIDGRTPINKLIRESKEMKEWRKKVFKRDNYTCQKTGLKKEKLHSHHICNFANYSELRFDINNGITLNEKAHKEFHKIYGYKNNREQLTEYLNAK